MIKNSIIKITGSALVGASLTLALTWNGTKDLNEIRSRALLFRQSALESIAKIEKLEGSLEAKDETLKELNTIIDELTRSLEFVQADNIENMEASKHYKGELSNANEEINKANTEVQQLNEDLKEILDVSIFE